MHKFFLQLDKTALKKGGGLGYWPIWGFLTSKWLIYHRIYIQICFTLQLNYINYLKNKKYFGALLCNAHVINCKCKIIF